MEWQNEMAVLAVLGIVGVGCLSEYLWRRKMTAKERREDDARLQEDLFIW